MMKRFKWELMQLFLSVFGPDPKNEIFFKKRGGNIRNIDFEIGVNAPAAK